MLFLDEVYATRATNFIWHAYPSILGARAEDRQGQESHQTINLNWESHGLCVFCGPLDSSTVK